MEVGKEVEGGENDPSQPGRARMCYWRSLPGPRVRNRDEGLWEENNKSWGSWGVNTSYPFPGLLEK